MVRIIFVMLFLGGCGQQLTPISPLDFQQKMSEGLRVARPSAEMAEVLDLSPSSGPVFQMLHIKGHPAIPQKILFDSSLMLVVGDAEAACRQQIAKMLPKGVMSHRDSLELVASVSLSHQLLQLSLQRKIDGISVSQAIVDCVFAIDESDKYRLSEIVNHGFFHLDLIEDKELDAQTIQLILGEGQIQGELNPVYVPYENVIVKGTQFQFLKDGMVYQVVLQNGSGVLIQGSPTTLSAAHAPVIAHVHERSYMEPSIYQESLPFTRLESEKGAIYSSSDGFVEGGLNVERVILDSRRVRVHQWSGEVIGFDQINQTDEELRVVSMGEEFSGLNSYASIHRINKFARRHLSPRQVPFLDQAMQVYVNAEGECNAFYSTGINRVTLYGEGGGCANLAEVNDVVYHEWGHGLDDHTGRIKGVTDNAFSEAIGDIISAYFNQDPIVGGGFVLGANYGLRDISQLKRYPEDQGNAHYESGIISGAFWDLNLLLKARYGAKKGADKAASLFFQHLLVTDSYHESYDSLLRLDDDDGNPATPSPNHCLINAAFARHGLAEEVVCQDKIARAYPADKNLNIALYDMGSDYVGLVASALEGSEFAVCFDSQANCLEGRRLQLRLEPLTENGERQFYHFQGPLPLTGVDELTLINRNEEGQIIGSRLVKIFTK